MTISILLLLMVPQQQIEQQRYGPSKALGGLSPEEYQAITHRKMLGKLMINPLVNGGLSPAYGPPPTPPTGNDSLLSPEAIDQSANLYLKTGQLPSLGRANPLLHGAILKRAAELSGGSDIATNRANLKADTGSLAKAQQQADAIESFENTALKNLDQFRQVASGVVDTGSPFFNKPLRSVMQKFAGDPRMAQFNAARQVAVQEIGKVLGGAVQGGAITDSQRHEVEGLLSGDMSLAQIDAVSRTLKQDMANRKASVAAQLGTIRGRISGGGAPATTEAPPTKRRRYNPATGQIEGP